MLCQPESIIFLSRNLKLSAHLYAPSADAPSRAGAAIIIAHPWTSIKEQSPANYARLLSAAGFTCLTYDAAYQGASDGQPRHLEDPAQRVEEIKNAVTYLSNRHGIDPTKIGVLGICAAGGYACFAAQTDVRLRAVATVSAACVGTLTRRGLEKDSPASEALRMQLELAAKDRSGEGEIPPVQMLPERFEDLPAECPAAMRDFASYYCTARGFHPRAEGLCLPRSWDLMANFEAFRFNAMISPRPLLMVVGEKAVSRWFSEEAVGLASEPKEVFVVEGSTHADLYDRVEVAGGKMVEFFGEYLV
ncbi:alpha/beta hydrolase [Aspergillus homomorphus CBS 101889]|uniref:Alpha/beta-hydrolase n=1 Tax=Aspergillus homomorphus (strain CBS 101889) TaxID=1450537 RepID=A0A395HL25_ASPHC|nr:alpha/beta-hydrolase [Aspergillus homomorphus CBS 101889]RAL08470.1 alpha/beta-hydrolase [Aspergillus homomorphus CBS 101889]